MMEGEVLGTLMAILASLSWATAAVLYRKALMRFSNPLITNGLRVPLAILTLLLIAFVMTGAEPIIYLLTHTDVLLLVFVATLIANVVGDTLYLVAIRNVGVSTGYPLSYTYPLMVAVLAAVFLREHIYLSLIAGTAIAILGVWLLSQKPSGNNESEIGRYSFAAGVVAALGASLSWSVAIVVLKVVVMGADPIAAAIFKLIFILVLVSPVMLVKHEEVRRNVDKRTLMFAMAGGIFGIGVGDWFLYVSLKMIGAARAAALTTSAPLLSLILAVLILKERVVVRQVFGTVLVVTGVLMVVLKPF